MPLHPVIAEFLASHPAPPPGPIDPATIRANYESRVPPAEKRQPVHSVVDRALPSPEGAVPVRVYTPTSAEAHPVIVYFHGGAFFVGSLDTHDHVTRELANATGCVVVSVGYRLAPENRFPAALNDGFAVVKWIAEHGAGIGWNGRTLALVGDSVGGNFATVISTRARDEGLKVITHQVLYYPSLDLDFDVERYESLRTNAVGYGLETAGLKPFNAFYINSGADPADPRVSPIKQTNLAGLPPALIVTAEYDPLRDEAEVYGRKLSEASVPTIVHRYLSAGHGFIQHFSWLPEFHGVFAETAEFLRGRA